MSRRGRVSKPRLDAWHDKWVRKAVEYARELAGAEYREIGSAVGKGERWCGNALNRQGRLPLDTARMLMEWAVEITERLGDKKSLGQVRLVASGLRKHKSYPAPVPLLVLSRDVRRISDAFDQYLRLRGCRGAARGLLGEFLLQPSGDAPKNGKPETHARACAWALSWHVRGIIAERSKRLTITSKGHKISVTPDDLQTLIYDLEWLVERDKLPRASRAALRRAEQRAAR